MNLSVRLLGRLAGAALANRVPLDHHELLVKVGEHAQALVDELFAPQRFALAIEQNRIAFDLGQREVRFIRGDDEFQKLSYDVGGVIDLRCDRKAGETADVGDQDDRLFSHSKKLSRCAAGLTVPSRLSRETLSGATSGKSKRSCSGSEINRLRKETLNLRGVAELSILSMGKRLLRCGMLDPPMSARGHSRHSRHPGASGSPQEWTFSSGWPAARREASLWQKPMR